MLYMFVKGEFTIIFLTKIKTPGCMHEHKENN